MKYVWKIPDKYLRYVLDGPEYAQEVGHLPDTFLTLSPMGGGLRGPPLAELAIAPKRIYVLIWNYLTFLIYQKPKFWKRKKIEFFTPTPLREGY